MTPAPPYPERLERLAGALREAGVDALFCASPITMGYLQGFCECGYERFLVLAVHRDGRARLICPSLTETQARRCGLQDIRAWSDGEEPLDLLRHLARDWDLASGVVAVDDDMPAAQLLAIQGVLPRAVFRPGQPLLARLMRAKSPGELEYLLHAGRIADEALPLTLARIRPGMSELEVAGMLLEDMRRLGGAPSFCLAATGANSAEPHHASDDSRIRQGDALILDFGCSVAGYQSDVTRTVAVGPASAELHNVYGIVLKAHLAARSAIQPGEECQEVDRAARNLIGEAGYEPFFLHRTGHGIGLRGHEEPYIVEGNEMRLAPGHCFSIEPGIYLPGRFGVRIENCVACTEDGHLSLNEEPPMKLVELSAPDEAGG